MLSPNTLEYIADDIVNLYSNLNNRIIEDIARRLINAGTMTESARWQIQIAQETGLLYDNIIEMVSENMETSEEVVRQIFEDAAIESLEFDDKIYRKAGLSPIPLMQSPSMLQILEASLIKTNGMINNLCMTTASSGQEIFIQALDNAYMDVITGAFDYNTAIFNAIDRISKDGMYIYYPSGYKEKIDVAVRKNIVTAIGQTTGQMQVERAKEMNCDLMEITAHEGARPTHEKWQGKIVSLSGRNGYLSTNDIGYGTITGFKGINCRHDWFPFFEGISERAYSDKELKELNNQTVKYNGQDIKIYDARQMQRGLERSIRENKRQLAGLNGVLTSNTDNQDLIEEAKSKFLTKSVELKQKESILFDFSEQTGLKRDKARERINRFDQSVSQKVAWSSKKSTNINNDDIIKKNIPNDIESFYNFIQSSNRIENLLSNEYNEGGYIASQELNNILGYDKLPTKVSKEMFTELANRNELGILYRGISGETQKECYKYIDDFYNGKLYIGGNKNGAVYGRGIYTGFGDMGKKTAYNYSNIQQHGQVIEMLLSDDAKIVSRETLYTMKNKEIDSFISKYYKEKYNINNYSQLIINLNKIKVEDEKRTSYILKLMDDGYYASIKGYDAIKIDIEMASQKYILILNRGKVIVNE